MALTKYRNPVAMDFHESLDKPGSVCMVCGKQAVHAYRNSMTGGFIFKHSRLVKDDNKPGKRSETTYCETKGVA